MESTQGLLKSVVGVDVCFTGEKANPHIDWWSVDFGKGKG
jgi:hypothetical protein